jgi:hypothetical protein
MPPSRKGDGARRVFPGDRNRDTALIEPTVSRKYADAKVQGRNPGTTAANQRRYYRRALSPDSLRKLGGFAATLLTEVP